MDRPAVRAGEDRRDPRHRQHLAARARNRISAPAKSRRPRCSRSPASRASITWRSCAKRALPTCRVFFIGDDCPPDATPYAQLRKLASAVSEAALDDRESQRRPRRRDQHAIHVGHDRVSQRRDALEPEHRQQRLLDRRRARLHARGPALPVRAAVPLLRLRARRPGGLYARRPASVRSNSSSRCARSKPSIVKGARRCTACRRCSSPSSSILTSQRFDTSTLRTGIMAGALVPRAADAARDRQMQLPELTIVYGLTETSPGLTQTPRDADLVERTQTVGRIMPETEVRIVDPQTGRGCARRRRRRAVGARLRR